MQFWDIFQKIFQYLKIALIFSKKKFKLICLRCFGRYIVSIIKKGSRFIAYKPVQSFKTRRESENPQFFTYIINVLCHLFMDFSRGFLIPRGLNNDRSIACLCESLVHIVSSFFILYFNYTLRSGVCQVFSFIALIFFFFFFF